MRLDSIGQGKISLLIGRQLHALAPSAAASSSSSPSVQRGPPRFCPLHGEKKRAERLVWFLTFLIIEVAVARSLALGEETHAAGEIEGEIFLAVW